MAPRNVRANLADRLSSTLFVAALAHGVVILGVTFATDPLEQHADLPSLNVTLLVDSADFVRSHEQRELLADRSVLGGGRPDDAERPTRTLSDDHPLSQLGDPLGADLTEGTPTDALPQTDRLTTRNDSETRIRAVPDAPDEPADVFAKAATLIERSEVDTRVAEIAEKAQTRRDDADNDLSNPSTSESALAEYLVGWRQRVERIGTANFPAGYLTRRSQLGRPTLEVAIGPEGNLEDIVVRKSSGDTSLDEVALKILRMAAPFEPLPSAILAEYDVLRFAYEWDFAPGDDVPVPLAAAD